MNYMESSRDSKLFAQKTIPGLKRAWLIWSSVLLVACVGSAQTTLAQVRLARATPTGATATKVSPVVTNAPAGQPDKVLQVQPHRSPAKGPH